MGCLLLQQESPHEAACLPLPVLCTVGGVQLGCWVQSWCAAVDAWAGAAEVLVVHGETLYACCLLPAELSSGVQYTRVPMDLPVTDPLQGLFVGHYGPHGPEVLQLERKIIVSIVVLSRFAPYAAQLRWDSLVADSSCAGCSLHDTRLGYTCACKG